MADTSIVLYRKAQASMGIFWDYKKDAVTHLSSRDDSNTTHCGLKILCPSYGWREEEKAKEPTCSACKEEFLKLKQKLVTSTVIATS
jgi:hypothetical protein